MDAQIDRLFQIEAGESGYQEAVFEIMRRGHDLAYMLFVPTPHKVFAANKELIFTPYKQACLPLWEMEISERHVSVRQGEYPEELKQPVEIVRKNFAQE
jgi:peptide/nickel transport system substrate-binding protein